jgi:hypothetical protein
MPIMGGQEMLTMLKSKPKLVGILVIIHASQPDHAVLQNSRTLATPVSS